MIHQKKFDILVLSCILVVLNSCNKEDSALSGSGQKRDLTPPIIADFAFVPDACSNHLTINFQNNSKNATSYDWDFGDGTNSTEPSPQKTFQQAGGYQVSLTAHTSVKNAVVRKSVDIVANSGGAVPDARFEVAINTNLKTEITITNLSLNADSYFLGFW